MYKPLGNSAALYQNGQAGMRSRLGEEERHQGLHWGNQGTQRLPKKKGSAFTHEYFHPEWQIKEKENWLWKLERVQETLSSLWKTCSWVPRALRALDDDSLLPMAPATKDWGRKTAGNGGPRIPAFTEEEQRWSCYMWWIKAALHSQASFPCFSQNMCTREISQNKS